MRKVTTGTPTAFVFNTNRRLTTYVPTSGTVTPFYRSTARTSVPNFTLALTHNASGRRDYAQVTFRPDATPGHDARYDAVRPGDNVGSPTLFTINAAAEACALNSLPLTTDATVVPLAMHTLVPGQTYTLQVNKNTLSAGTHVYLTDQESGRVIDLTRQSQHTFIAQANTYEHRFVLRFESTQGTIASTFESATISTFPNPGQAGSPLEFKSKAVKGSTATATLLDTFGRTVTTLEVPVRDGQLAGSLPTKGLAPGIYILRLHGTDKVTTQRIQIR